jgi:hypothetical protein
MNISKFIQDSNLKPADAIVLNKKLFGMLDHYAIYVGFIDMRPRFVANYVGGVEMIPEEKITDLLEVYVPSNIERFPGPNNKRGEAVKRALSRIGEKAYSLLLNNCEHFKNFVHHGIENSTQVEKAGYAMILGGTGLTLIGIDRKNTNTAILGVFIALIGIILAIAESDNKDKGKKEEQ